MVSCYGLSVYPFLFLGLAFEKKKNHPKISFLCVFLLQQQILVILSGLLLILLCWKYKLFSCLVQWKRGNIQGSIWKSFICYSFCSNVVTCYNIMCLVQFRLWCKIGILIDLFFSLACSDLVISKWMKYHLFVGHWREGSINITCIMSKDCWVIIIIRKGIWRIQLGSFLEFWFFRKNGYSWEFTWR